MKKHLILCLISVLFLSGCFNSKPEVEGVNPNFGGEISLFAYTPDFLNPLQTKYQTNASVLSIISNSLVNIQQDLSVTPELATEWDFSEDGKSCTFSLNQNVKFHDGSKLTSTDVLNSLDILKQNPDSIYYPVIKYISTYRAKSSYEFEVKLNEAGNTFLSYMDFPIVKKDNDLIGTGPYKLVSNDNRGINLTANTECITKPNIENIYIGYYPKNDMAEFAFLTGETNVISADFYKLAQLSSKTNVTKTEYVSDYFTFLGFNLKSNVFANPETRYAIASLIDKNEMTKTILVNYAKPVNSPFKPDSIYGNLYAGDYGYDENSANTHLHNANIKSKDLKFTILVNSESPAKTKTAEFIVQKLKSINIDATVVNLGYNDYIKAINDGNYTAFIGEITMSRDYDLRFLLNSQKNYFNYSNQYLDTVINNYLNATDYQNKQIYAQEMQNILLNDLPFISLYYRTNVLLTDNKIKGEFKPEASNIYRNIHEWIVK